MMPERNRVRRMDHNPATIPGESSWAHAPLHRYKSGAMMITGATYHKALIFHTPDRLKMLQNTIFEKLQAYRWELQAWAVMANHYHLIAYAPEDNQLRTMMQELHSETARRVNEMDGVRGRRVWYQYWDTNLTNPKSYYARFNYVLHNPEKHGLVKNAIEYPWCSMSRFMADSETAFQKTVLSFKFDAVNVYDPF